MNPVPKGPGGQQRAAGGSGYRAAAGGLAPGPNGALGPSRPTLGPSFGRLQGVRVSPGLGGPKGLKALALEGMEAKPRRSGDLAPNTEAQGAHSQGGDWGVVMTERSIQESRPRRGIGIICYESVVVH